MSTLEDQLALELEMLQAGIDRYQSNTSKLLEKGIESKTKHGRAVIAAVVNAVADGVDEIQSSTTSNRDIAKKKLQGMNPSQINNPLSGTQLGQVIGNSMSVNVLERFFIRIFIFRIVWIQQI